MSWFAEKGIDTYQSEILQEVVKSATSKGVNLEQEFRLYDRQGHNQI